VNSAPRLLIPAFGVGTYVFLRLGLGAGEWDEAAVYAAVAFALVLFGPALLHGGVKKAVRSSSGKKKTAKAKEGEAS
jgi:hypothetical protein